MTERMKNCVQNVLAGLAIVLMAGFVVWAFAVGLDKEELAARQAEFARRSAVDNSVKPSVFAVSNSLDIDHSSHR